MLLFGPAILATHLLNFLSKKKKLEDTVFQVKLMVHECFILLSKHNSCDIKSSTQTAASLDSWIVSQKFSNAFTYTFFLGRHRYGRPHNFLNDPDEDEPLSSFFSFMSFNHIFFST